MSLKDLIDLKDLEIKVEVTKPRYSLSRCYDAYYCLTKGGDYIKHWCITDIKSTTGEIFPDVEYGSCVEDLEKYIVNECEENEWLVLFVKVTDHGGIYIENRQRLSDSCGWDSHGGYIILDKKEVTECFGEEWIKANSISLHGVDDVVATKMPEYTAEEIYNNEFWEIYDNKTEEYIASGNWDYIEKELPPYYYDEDYYDKERGQIIDNREEKAV